MMSLRRQQPGFTLPELLVTTAIIGIFATLTVVNLLPPQTSASVNSALTTFIADVRSQQLKAMTGDTEGSGIISDYGLYLESTRYVLFRGSTYSSADPANFPVDLDPPLDLTTDLSGSVLVFLAGSGEISGYNSAADTVTLTHGESGQIRTLEFNRYGIITSEN